MKLSSTVKLKLKSVIFGILLASSTYPAIAALNIADVPLYLNEGTEPNIMFTIDDSGSMQWEIMPSQYVYAYFVFPRAENVYSPSGSQYSNIVVSFTGTQVFSRAMRSSDINNTYYNPKVTYTPWSKPDATAFPNAVVSAAYHNPMNIGDPSAIDYDAKKYTRNLTASNNQWASWRDCSRLNGGCSASNETRTFWPAVYYNYSGTDSGNIASYTKVEIKPPSAGGTDTYIGGPNRLDCASRTTCSYAEEIQNFANWYTYYRSRILAARAGIGKAFAVQGTNMRVGFSAINQAPLKIDEVNSPGTIASGLREFAGSDRDNFFTKLYTQPIKTSGTPLRQALDDVGQYFTRTDNTGPWSKTPGTEDTSAHLSCRQSYNILMTDGYWNGPTVRTSGARANVDNTIGTTITNPESVSYQYTPVNPYKDSSSGTLADVSMYYWNRDLRPDLENKVTDNVDDPAFWQHLVNFTVGLGVSGTLNHPADLTNLESGSKTWPNPFSGNLQKIDDLWHTAINSRGDFFSASDPDTFADALTDTLNNIAKRNSSSSAITANSTQLNTNTVIYQALFDSEDWSGDVIAYKLNPDGSIDSSPKWTAASNIPSDSDNRKIFTINSGVGKEFKWGSLNATQKIHMNTDINGNTDSLGPDRVEYIRGDKSNESTFRKRNSLLGDIINSDPIYVGKTDYDYDDLTGDDGNEGLNYVTFRSSSAYTGRSDTLFVGSNDGMLHAIDAATGIETFSYVPNELMPNLSKLTSPDYTHQYYVDGSIRTGDAYLTNSIGGQEWKTVLVSSLGAGGKAIFALDITDPDNFAASNVLWEFTHDELGYTIGQPTIIRMYDGSWAAVFGNGYNSTSGKAQLFIVNLSDVTDVTVIDTGKGSISPGEENGLATIIPIDVDNDKITDYIYGGDLQGNMWKFDVTSKNPDDWNIPFKVKGKIAPLITVVDDNGNVQPITSRPEVGRHPDGGYMVFFGTGKFFEVGDNVIGSPAEVQTFYAIRDYGNKSISDGRTNLVEQKILAEVLTKDTGFSTDVRVTSDYDVASDKDGWYMDLVSPLNGTEGERVTSRPVLRNGRIIFVTQIPSSDPCTFGGESWLMEVEAYKGARIDIGVFDIDGDGEFTIAEFVKVGEEKLPASGVRSGVGLIKTPNIIDAGDVEYKITSGSSGGIESVREDDASPTGGRQSWKQLQ